MRHIYTMHEYSKKGKISLVNLVSHSFTRFSPQYADTTAPDTLVSSSTILYFNVTHNLLSFVRENTTGHPHLLSVTWK